MSEKENDIPMSKKGQREVSPFVGHELLYDYLCGKLDDERKKAVEDHLKYSRDAQLDLGKIQNGQSYAERLAVTIVSEPVLEQISSPSTYLSVLMQKSNFERWPLGLKWGLEALVVVGVIVVLLTLAPWEKVVQLGVSNSSKTLVLAEVTKTNPNPDVAKKADADTPKFADEGAPPKEAAKNIAANSGAEVQKNGSVVPSMTSASSSPSPTVTGTAASVLNNSTSTAASANDIATKKAAELQKNVTDKAVAVAIGAKGAAGNEGAANQISETSADSAKPISSGFLYRGSVQIANLEMTEPKITEKIKQLGGRKAGDVELGWKKAPHSAYYHFTIPEAKYQELLTFISSSGKAKILKEKHPRVMPDGIIRLIITLDQPVVPSAE